MMRLLQGAWVIARRDFNATVLSISAILSFTSTSIRFAAQQNPVRKRLSRALWPV